MKWERKDVGGGNKKTAPGCEAVFDMIVIVLLNDGLEFCLIKEFCKFKIFCSTTL